jgi:sulfatase modifying factor 1
MNETKINMQSPATKHIQSFGAFALLLALCNAGCAQSVVVTAPALPVTVASAPSPATGMSQLSQVVAPTLATAKIPGNPKINTNDYISEKKLAALPVPQQSPELAKALAELQKGSVDERKVRLKTKVIAEMVYVQGGSFMRGDFARLMGLEGVTRMTSKEDDKIVKEISLSDFWISKYKVTYAEFDVFTDAVGKPRAGMEYDADLRHPTIPARAYWQSAKDYCLWLGELTGLPMDLPTEAQWEYAARSRGQFFMVATDNGNVEYGRNLPYGAQERVISPVETTGRYPVGLFPSNPLGLYDMSDNGTEWVNDWYSPDAYATADTRNPQGPVNGIKKVIRSGASDSPLIGSTVHRYSANPLPTKKDVDTGKIIPSASAFAPALRCAVTPH